MNPLLFQKLEEWLNNLSERELNNLEYDRFARFVNIEDGEASEYFKELNKSGIIILKQITRCNNCGAKIIIDKSLYEDEFECEECESILNIKKLEKHSTISYKISREFIMKNSRQVISPFNIKSTDKVIDIDKVKSIKDIKSNGVDVLKDKDIKKLSNDDSNKISTIKIAHISDLHFGSDYNTGNDNKAGLIGISNIAPDIFNEFAKKINKVNANYLIISGDLTSKNQENGFDDFNNKIQKISIPNDNIYIVPGNHECDRTKNGEIGQFAMFTAYTNKFKTNFSSENYILDEQNKIFIYGFNSVNFKKEGGQELFYIKNEEFEKLDNICDRLTRENEEFIKYIKIAVLHNNLIPHPNIEIKEYAEVLNTFLIKYKLINLGFKLACSGHKHEELIEKHTVYTDNYESEIILVSAPSLCSNVYNSRNGFQVINIIVNSENEDIRFKIDRYELNNVYEFELKKSFNINM